MPQPGALTVAARPDVMSRLGAPVPALARSGTCQLSGLARACWRRSLENWLIVTGAIVRPLTQRDAPTWTSGMPGWVVKSRAIASRPLAPAPSIAAHRSPVRVFL